MQTQIENEKLTEADVSIILKHVGIPSGSSSEFDYVKAKRILIGDFGIDPERYSELLHWIIEYVNC